MGEEIRWGALGVVGVCLLVFGFAVFRIVTLWAQ